MARHRDGAVHVLLNRCTHRGAKVVNERRGHAHAPDLLLSRLDVRHRRQAGRRCRCRKAAPQDFDKEAFGLARAPRVGEYRGFVFASLAAKGPSFEDHIGPMKGNIDDLVDRAPDGTLALDAGMHRYVYNGNWKLQVENVLDSYHVPFGHASTVNKQGVQFARREGDQKGAAVVETEKKQTAASLEGPQELHRRQRPRLDQQHHARRRQALEPGLRRIQARAGGEGRRRTGGRKSSRRGCTTR